MINMNLNKTLLDLDKQSIHWKVELDPEQTLQFVSEADAYNGFTQDDLVKLVKSVNEIIPPMKFPGENPNNGKTHHKFIVGNECSRVIYLQIIKTYLPKDFDYTNLIVRLSEIGAKANADENDLHENENGSFKWRWWFD